MGWEYALGITNDNEVITGTESMNKSKENVMGRANENKDFELARNSNHNLKVKQVSYAYAVAINSTRRK